MKPANNEIQIDLTMLKPGMYVIKLDIPWIESPFLKHKRFIKNDAEITKLQKAGVKKVYIDIHKGLVPDMDQDEFQQNPPDSPAITPPKPPTQNKQNGSAKDSDNGVRKSSNSSGPVGLDQERNAALKIRALIMYLAHDIYSAMEGDKHVDKEKVKELTDLAVQSLKRNEHALMNLVHIQQKSRKLTCHAFSVFGLALNFGLHLKLSYEEMDQLATAALLHEAGWIKLPGNLMGKRVAYNETEKQLIRQHPTVGVSLLAKTGLDKNTQSIILQHHENCDGSGYPNNIKKENIHRLARALAICDSYDEWIHQLRDIPGMLPATAIKQLFQAAEKNILDKDLVHSFISMVGIYPVTSAILLNTGEKGTVREVLPSALKTPSIAIWYDKKGFVLGEPIIVDLAKQNPKDPQRTIEKVIDPDNPSDDPAKRLKSELE